MQAHASYGLSPTPSTKQMPRQLHNDAMPVRLTTRLCSPEMPDGKGSHAIYQRGGTTWSLTWNLAPHPPSRHFWQWIGANRWYCYKNDPRCSTTANRGGKSTLMAPTWDVPSPRVLWLSLEKVRLLCRNMRLPVRRDLPSIRHKHPSIIGSRLPDHERGAVGCSPRTEALGRLRCCPSGRV